MGMSPNTSVLAASRRSLAECARPPPSMTAAGKPVASKARPSPYTADIAIDFKEASSVQFVQ